VATAERDSLSTKQRAAKERLFRRHHRDTSVWPILQTFAQAFYTDLFVGEITRRILGPGVVGEVVRAHAGVAAANVEVLAGTATALDRAWAGLEYFEPADSRLRLTWHSSQYEGKECHTPTDLMYYTLLKLEVCSKVTGQ
jgi:hypothetical protein